MVIINSWERQHLPIILGPGCGRKVKVRSQPGLHSKFCVKNKIGNINNALIIFNSVCHQAKNHWRELGHFSVSVLLWDTCQKITRSRDLSRALHTRVHSNISQSCWLWKQVWTQVKCERKQLPTSDYFCNGVELYSGLSEGNWDLHRRHLPKEINYIQSNKHPMIPLTQATWRNLIHSDWDGLSWEDLDSLRRQTTVYTCEGPFRLL